MTDLQESAEENMGRNLKIILIVSMLIVTTFFCFLPKILLYYASKKEATEMDRSDATIVFFLISASFFACFNFFQVYFSN